MDAVDALQEGALARRRLQVDPAVLVVAAVVVRERRERAVFVGRQEQPRLQHRLEAVADAEDQLLVVAELAKGVGEEVLHVEGLHLARGHVVAVGEAAGEDEDLVVAEQAWDCREGRSREARSPRPPTISKAVSTSWSQLVPGARRIRACGVAMTKNPRRRTFVLDPHKRVRQTRCNVRVPPQPVGLTDRRRPSTIIECRQLGGRGAFPFFSPPSGGLTLAAAPS